jgi:ubiquinol-cytochrome c reductase cytochrome c1 subunit
MIKIIKQCLTIGSFIMFLSCNVLASEQNYPLQKAPIDPTDLVSLQRGAKLFMNYCTGCHSLKYMRYNSLASGIGIVDGQGKIMEQAVKENLMFDSGKITDPILSAMKKEEGANWFGIAPPDLSLVSRSRGVDWLYTYLKSFYIDNKKQWGVNNYVYPDVAMPHVLYNLQQTMTAEEYDRAIADIVNFLSYVGEPIRETRKRIGIWVLLFLGIFLIFAILLKREYWKDVK